MVCESGEVDADADAVWDEVDSKPEESDGDDKDGAVVPFAATRGWEEGESAFIFSFSGEGEGADGFFWPASPNEHVNGKNSSDLIVSSEASEGWLLLVVAPALRSLAVPAGDEDPNEVVERGRECVRR